MQQETQYEPGDEHHQHFLRSIESFRRLAEDHAPQLAQLRAEYLSHVLSSERTDRARLEEAIRTIYGEHRFVDRYEGEQPVYKVLGPPREIIWFDGPADLIVAASLLSTVEKWIPGENGLHLSKALRAGTTEFLRETHPQPGQPDALSEQEMERQVIPYAISLERALNRALSIEHTDVLWRVLGGAIADEIMMRTVTESIQIEGMLGVWEDKHIFVLEPTRANRVAEYLAMFLGAAGKKIRIAAANASSTEHFSHTDSPGRWWNRSMNYHSPFNDALDLLRIRACEMLGLSVNATKCGAQPLIRRELFVEAMEAGGWWVPFENICLACDNPSEIHLIDDFRIHNEDGPALVFGDGFRCWALQGVPLPENVVRHQFSPYDIDQVRNAEVRRVMIEHYGLGAYVADSGLKPVHSDEYGILYRKEFANDEALAIVAVRNSTAEADGSRRTYFLRVPPDVSTAKAAIAWTFGFAEGEYEPTVES